MSNKNLTIGVVVAIILATIGIFTPAGKQFLGAVTGETNYNTIGVSGLKVGSTCNDSFGSSGCQTVAKVRFGTCALYDTSNGVASTLAASTTRAIDCQATEPLQSGAAAESALTGVVANDTVVLHFSTTTPTTTNSTVGAVSLTIVGYSASTTAGYITAIVANNTGATQTLGSTTIRNLQYIILR